jgi:hypothetical protein
MNSANHSVLQNGYAILAANSSGIDEYLLANDALKTNIERISMSRLSAQQSAITERQTQIDGLTKMIATGSLDEDTQKKYEEYKTKLQDQIDRIKERVARATFDDLRKSHALFIAKTYKPMVSVAYGYQTTRTTPLPLLGSSSRIKIPINGDFLTDSVLYIKMSSFKATHQANKVRYCDFPGHRIIREVRFVMDGVTLDSYTRDDINFFYDFNVSRSQSDGWKRCVGQEVGKRAIFLQDPTNQEVREEKVVFDGYQTLKKEQPEMEIFLPLQFWFCNPKHALSNYNILFDKTFIEVDFASVDELVSITDYANDGGVFDPPKIVDYALMTNHVYTVPEVVDLVVSRNAFTIARVHRRATKILDKPYDTILLDQLRFATEVIRVCFKPLINERGDNWCETWNKNTVIDYKTVDYPSIVRIAGTKTLAYTPAYFYGEQPTVDAIGMSVDGSNLYESQSHTFFDSYMPYRYGKDSIITPNRRGSYMLTFSLFPQEDQPSGYVNLSNTRDNFLHYSSSYISVDTPVRMIISSQTINFMHLDQGKVNIRFAT